MVWLIINSQMWLLWTNALWVTSYHSDDVVWWVFLSDPRFPVHLSKWLQFYRFTFPSGFGVMTTEGLLVRYKHLPETCLQEGRQVSGSCVCQVHSHGDWVTGNHTCVHEQYSGWLKPAWAAEISSGFRGSTTTWILTKSIYDRKTPFSLSKKMEIHYTKFVSFLIVSS